MKGNRKAAIEITTAALHRRAGPVKLVGRFMISATDEVGRLFECQEYFVPESLLAAP